VPWVLLAARAAPAGPALLAPEEPPFAVSGFTLERMRKDATGGSNRVTASFTVQAGAVPVSDLVAKIDYVDYAGKVLAAAGPSRIGDLAVGEKKQGSVSGLYVPLFNGYVMKFTGVSGGKSAEWRFFGASGADQPTYLPSKPIPKTALLVLMASELEQSANSPRANLYLRVRNLGAAQAREAACFVEVRGKDGKRLGNRVRAPLAGEQGGRPGVVNGGEERLFVIQFARFPQFENFAVELDWKQPPAEEMLSGGEFTGAPEVELAHFAFKRGQSDSLEISAVARNGLDRPIEKLRVTLRLLERPRDPKRPAGSTGGPTRVVKTVEHVIPGRLAPGSTAPFSATATGVGSFDDFEYEVSYDEPGPGQAAAGAPGGGRQPAPPAVKIAEAVRRPDGTVAISGSVEQAGPGSVTGVEIVLSFLRARDGEQEVVKKLVHKLPGTLSPGRSAAFSLAVPDCPAFDEYFFEVRFEPASAEAPSAEAL